MEQFLDILRVESGWNALLVFLDMAIVYYVIYRILLLIKGTRAVQMIIGLVLVLVFYFLSQDGYLNLATTHWFIERFIANFIIIVVIIFQRDIRRALARVGRTSLLSGTRGFEETQVIEEVIKASMMLSSRKIGALIAIEREADLTPYTEEGIQIGAEVSKDILYNLFLPEHQNPLHDGAVIIQQSRVTAAGCFLPLTNDPAVEQSLGTRHRAGIGITEETDAAVVMVSEETGVVSIAYDGDLYRHLEATEMREMLQKLYGGQPLRIRRSSFLDRFRDQDDRNQSMGEVDLDGFIPAFSAESPERTDDADDLRRSETAGEQEMDEATGEVSDDIDDSGGESADETMDGPEGSGETEDAGDSTERELDGGSDDAADDTAGAGEDATDRDSDDPNGEAPRSEEQS